MNLSAVIVAVCHKFNFTPVKDNVGKNTRKTSKVNRVSAEVDLQTKCDSLGLLLTKGKSDV